MVAADGTDSHTKEEEEVVGEDAALIDLRVARIYERRLSAELIGEIMWKKKPSALT